MQDQPRDFAAADATIPDPIAIYTDGPFLDVRQLPSPQKYRWPVPSRPRAKPLGGSGSPPFSRGQRRLRSGPPPAHPLTVGFVLSPERSLQGRLLVPHHEQGCREKDQPGVAEKRARLIEECSAGKGEPGADIHGIPHDPVGTLHHEPARRIKWSRGPFTESGEVETP